MPNKFFESEFTGDQLDDFISEKFPDAFGIEIHKEVDEFTRRVCHINENARIYKSGGRYSPEIFGKNDERKFRLYWPETRNDTTKEYSRFRPRFEVYSGDENTYIYFMLEDEKNDNFIATWGYKRCDVERNYLIEFINELYK